MWQGAPPVASPLTLATTLTPDNLPGLTAKGAWFFADGAWWLAPFDG